MKPLPPGSHLVRPFKSYKGNQYTIVYSGSSNPEGIAIDEAQSPPINWTWSGSEEPINNDGVYKKSLYKSVEQMFFPQVTSSARPPSFGRGWDISDSSGSSVYVVNISQQLFGERVRPTTFVLTTTAGTGSISDDGTGKLYFANDTSRIIGNIFYPLGIAVIGQMITAAFTGSVLSHEGMYLQSGDDVSIAYESQVTIFDHTVVCTIEKDEMNYSSNPSLNLFYSSSVSGSQSLIGAMMSGTLTPYITTLGLYNSVGEMIMVAKVPRAIRRFPEIDQSFVVKIDI